MPTYQAQVWSVRDRRPVRKSFATLAEALAWRQDTQVAMRRGTMRAPSKRTLREAAEEWLEAAESGLVLTRSGDRFKPSALRSYREALHAKLLPALGNRRLSALTRNEIQDFIDRLVAHGLAPSTVRNTILPLRAIYGRALQRDEVAVNPTARLILPAVRGRRDLTVSPATAAQLIEALPLTDQALWATAFFTGLRRGELQALRWSDIKFDDGVIEVNHSWDQRGGLIGPKSRAGQRRVPLTSSLRRHLIRHQLQSTLTRASDHVFANRHGRPFDPGTILNRARAAWKRGSLTPIGLHDCRHSYAAFMIAANVNAKALSSYMGHSSITTTFDRYGHLLPGNEREASARLDKLLSNQLPASHTGTANSS
jgi:integrase